ncbi:MAG TPA: hypothetical protein VMV29_06340 [Ktedonobacterales bacterium]|nr:hypothetical protein [Ktedonobacterales bacterium]
MVAIVVFATQAALSLVTFGLIARWSVYPRLATRPLAAALMPLLLFNTLRTIGLCFVVPTLVDPTLPAGFTVPGEVGDMTAVVLALLSLAALRFSWPGAMALVWLFNIEGIADLLYATYNGMRYDIPANYHLGPAWLIPTYFVPAYIVAHIVIFALLLRRRSQPAPRADSADFAAASQRSGALVGRP